MFQARPPVHTQSRVPLTHLHSRVTPLLQLWNIRVCTHIYTDQAWRLLSLWGNWQVSAGAEASSPIPAPRTSSPQGEKLCVQANLTFFPSSRSRCRK